MPHLLSHLQPNIRLSVQFSLTVIFVVISSFSIADIVGTSSTIEAESPSSFDHQHQRWGETLNQIVQTKGAFSRVDYQKLKNHPEGFLEYLKQIESVNRQDFDRFTQEQQLAFLINYYNAHQIQQVIDNYPLDSIRDLGFLFSTPWKKEFFTIFGQSTSLVYVEHELIRKLFKEPRIHFAVNCASIGCPPLLHEPFQAEKLQHQLEHVATNFLNAKPLNSYSKAQHQLTLSPIFKWYAQDFGDEKALQSFIARYMTGFVLKNSLAAVEYSDYDWNLNDTKTLK